ncbi:hypothetical protein ES705_46776 [subsurface metagenome]
MILLTPELYCRSQLTDIGTGANVDAFAQLDFNLSRRTGILINEVIGEIALLAQVAVGAGQILQQLDLDPDNEAVEMPANTVITDSSRPFSQMMQYQIATTEVTTHMSLLQVKWRAMPMHERPISITNLVHEVQGGWGTRTDTFTAVLTIYYQIVELTLAELGMLNASRR